MKSIPDTVSIQLPRFRVVLLFWLVAAAGGCGEVEGDLDDLGTTSVRYELTWNEAGVVRGQESLRFTTSEGFELELSTLQVTTRSIALVPCETNGLMTRVASLLSAEVAHAGHGDETDPSTIDEFIEDLLRPDDEALTIDLAFEPADYCEVHYLVARSFEEPHAGQSLRVVGEACRSGECVPLDIQSGVANGRLFQVELSSGAVAVEVTRTLASLFDGVDFQEPEEAIERTVLRNLLADSEVLVSERF